MAKAAQSEISRVGKFGLVGILNTVIDLTVLNLLVAVVGLPKIPANVISTTCAMLFSFFANQRLVFKSKGNFWRQTVTFFSVTAFGLYILQNTVIILLSDVWLAPVHLGLTVAHAIGLSRIFSDSFLVLNGVKAAGIAVSMVWNYTMYKKVVFKNG